MQAHANDLRAEVEKDWQDLTSAAADGGSSTAFDAFVDQAVDDWRACPLNPKVQALLEYAEKVTRAPASCERRHVQHLRELGWSDVAIHDAVQVIAYFNYINRIADALGVEPEAGLPHWGRGCAGE